MKEKTKKERKKIFKRGIPKFWSTLAFETLYIFLIEIIFKLMLGSLLFDYTLLRIFISSIILSLIVTTITTNMKTGWRKGLLIFFNFFITLYAWLQLGFFDYLGAFMSIGNASQGTKIGDYVLDFLISYDLKTHLIYIPFILSIVYYILEKKILKKGYDKKIEFKNWFKSISLMLSFLILCDLFYMTIEVDFMQNKYQTIPNKTLFKNPSSPSVAIKNFGTSIYFILDVKSTAFGGAENVYASNTSVKNQASKTRTIDDTAWKELIESETDSTLNALNNYFINRDITETNEYTGIFKDKNVIFIMMESVSAAVFQDEYKEYFPTLYKLYNEGITGVNNYSPKNNCATGESEMTAQLSLYSIETTCTVNTYQDNEYPEAIMSMFAKNGYTTSTYHDYTDQYYSRSVYEENFGAMAYYGVKDLGMKYTNIYKEWPSDLTFMQEASKIFLQDDKFAAFMVTVTSHAPYMYSSEQGDLYLSLFDDLDIDTTTKRYLSKIKVLDTALEYLLDTLEEEGKLDDTVLVLFGDHYPYALSDKQYQSIAGFDISENQETDRTPFIIYNSATDASKITKVTTPLDYTPTVLNLFGIDYDPRLYLGNDVFSDYTDFAVFPDNSWQSSKGFYSTAKGEFYAKDENDTLTDEEIIELNNEVNTLRNMSALAIKKNYFKYLFDYFDEYEKSHKKDAETITTEEKSESTSETESGE